MNTNDNACQQPLVTVLMAVYNGEAFLQESLDSLMSQTFTAWECICVDDCSTDGTLQLLNDYARRDPRIRVVHLPENHGQAFARNKGLQLSSNSSQYVCMLDADDWLSADALQSAVDAFASDEQTDSVLFDVMLSWPDRQEMYPLPPFTVMEGKQAFRLSLDWRLHGLYMVRRGLHLRYPYDDSCHLYSDDNTTRLHYLFSRHVGRCRGIYYYRQHSASATHSVTADRFLYLKANESMHSQLIEAGVGSDVIQEYERLRWLNLVDVYMFYHCHGHQLTRQQRRDGLALMRHTWDTVEQSQPKFGYRHMPSWPLFRLQEWLYFTLRGLLGRNK